MTTPLETALAALRHGCALIDHSSALHLELTGADRQRFLNGLVTCDVKALAPGQGCYGFFTDGKGRVLADVVVLALEDRLWLEVPPGQEEALAAHLRKYIIADRVEVSLVTDRVAVTLAGAGATGLLAIALPEAPWSNLATAVDGRQAQVVREGRLGLEGISFWVAADDAAHVQAFLSAQPGVVSAGAEALDIVRIEAGIGRFGQDFGSDTFPQETGAETAAVSYTKGCYLGQEIVARIHYRGGVQRALRGLRFENTVAPAVGTAVMHEARESGRLTSVTRSALGTIGLAVLHQRVGDEGGEVELATGEKAILAALPFAAA